MKKQLYIAYGSNLHRGQMAQRCPTAQPIAKAWLEDYRLVYQGRPGNAHANVIPEKGHKVPVVIWEISEQNERALDRYEGVAGGYYTKEYVEIECNGEKVKALIYLMTPNPFNHPSDFYLNVIVQGYRHFNLPAEYLNESVKYTLKQIQKNRKENAI